MMTSTTVPRSPNTALPLEGGIRGRITGVTRIGPKAGLFAGGITAALFAVIIYGIGASGKQMPSNTNPAATAQPLPVAIAGDAPSLANIPGATRGDASATPVPRLASVPARNSEVQRTAQNVPVRSAALQYGGASSTAAVPAPAAVTMPQIAAPSLSAAPAISPRMLAEARSAATAQAVTEERARILKEARESPIIVAANQMNAVSAVRDAAANAGIMPGTTTAKAQNSPYTIRTGTIIPAVLISGITSDLPGQLIAQVAANVYDSQTGKYLLIPSGARITGSYNSQTASGRQRVLALWQRIVFPDGRTLELGNVESADAAGNAGLVDSVDNHTAKKYRNTFLFSILGAGAALLAPPPIAIASAAGTVVVPSVRAQAVSQLSGNLVQTAQSQTQGSENQPPTVTVHPGYLFNIMVDHDVVLDQAVQ